MKVKDILKTQHTTLVNISGYTTHDIVLSDYTQTDLTLYQILFQLSDKYKDAIDYLRNMEDKKEQKEYKCNYPCWFVSGTFPFKETTTDKIISYSNIISVDIDYKDNENTDFNKLKQDIFKLPYVFYVSKSIRGNGIYALLLVEDGQYTVGYCSYIQELWNQIFNIKCDAACKDLTRKRFISYDDEYMIKDDECDIMPWKLHKIYNNLQTPSGLPSSSLYLDLYKPPVYNKEVNKDFTRKAIWFMLNRGHSIDDYKTGNNYAVWYYVACEFARFDDGFEMFYKFSTNSIHYKDTYDSIKKKFADADVNKVSNEEVAKKWQGLCKNNYGKNWWKIVNIS